MLNVIIKYVNWTHKVFDTYTFLQMIYGPIDPVDKDLALITQLH